MVVDCILLPNTGIYRSYYITVVLHMDYKMRFTFFIGYFPIDCIEILSSIMLIIYLQAFLKSG